MLDLPDNVTASRRGTLVLCEDGDGDNYLRGLSKAGQIFDFCGCSRSPATRAPSSPASTFGPGGHTLYVNVQARQGMSIAIWGPWERGPF